jgi:hypothetical protein
MNSILYNNLKKLDIKINILKDSSEIGVIEKNLDNNLYCPICLKKLPINKNIKRLESCNHKFHIKCINTWLSKNNNCPTCRLNY